MTLTLSEQAINENRTIRALCRRLDNDRSLNRVVFFERDGYVRVNRPRSGGGAEFYGTEAMFDDRYRII